VRVCSPEENDQDEERIEKPKDIGEAGEVSREGTTEDRVAGGPYGPLAIDLILRLRPEPEQVQ
jgi:hypothetical protein